MAPAKLKLQERIDEVIDALNTLREDEGLPKNIRAKIDSIAAILGEDAEVSSKVGRSIQVIDEISEDLNLQPFIRTQIWHISSMLEKLNK